MKFLAIAAFAAAIFAVQAPAHAAQNAVGGLKGQSGTSQATPLPCKGVQRCNSVIAYCAQKDGKWKEGSHNTQGQPTSGTCTLP